MRIGIFLVGSKAWQGGVIYVQNVLRALHASRPRELRAFLVTDDANLEIIADHADIVQKGLAHGLIHIGQRTIHGSESFPCTRIASWDALGALVDVAFPGGWAPHFGPEVIGWIPDFQYRHLPELFPPAELAYRRQHDERIAEQARHVVFSSEDARCDFRALFPNSPAIEHVLPFHSVAPAELFAQDGSAVVRKYGCPTEYLICSNQFWTHKNHRVLFAALERLADRGRTLPLVCTGSPRDHRDNGYFEQLLAELGTWNTAGQVRLLGLIPRDDQLQLLRQARAVVQPSLFEGWSTVVEDARGLGVPLFLSDIAVHREQAPPHAHYFPPRNPEALADLIEHRLGELPRPGPARERAGREHTATLDHAFGQRLWAVLDRVSAERAPVPAIAGSAVDRPLVATSLAPRNLERQKVAVSSWIAQGFDVVSVNVAEEIERLTPEFPEVIFRAATRDARALAGKPLVPLDDLLAVLRAEGRPLSGIVNSDIVLCAPGERDLAAILRDRVGDGMAFVKRIDQENEADPGTRYEGGIDGFFFGSKVLFAYPATPYFLGLPWWDYFFAAFPVLAGFPVFDLRGPVAFHLSHPSFYDLARHYVPLATDTLALLMPLLQQRPDLVQATGMAEALAAIWNLSSAPSEPPDVEILCEGFDRFGRAMLRLINQGSTLQVYPGEPKTTKPVALSRPAPRPRRSPLRIGIPIGAGDHRVGRIERTGHLLRALAQLPAAERPHTTLVLLPGATGAAPVARTLSSLVDQVIEPGDLDRALVHVDFLFAAYLVPLPGRPGATSIPDVQHRWFPNLLPRALRRARDAAHQAIAEQADLLVLDSQTAERDWQLFHRGGRPVVRVIRPRAAEDPSWFELDPAAVAAKHGLLEPFVICGNRYWIPCGHTTIVDAVSRLPRAAAPRVVFTGALDDESQPGYIDLIRGGIAQAGLAGHIRMLGNLPRPEQMALVRGSLAVIEASAFHGFSPVVEEARALGKTVFLSERLDEQIGPRTHLFRPHSPEHLASTLARVLPGLTPGPAPDEVAARSEGRELAVSYARAVVTLAHEALASTSPREVRATEPASTAPA